MREVARDLEAHQRRQIAAIERLGVVRSIAELSLDASAALGDPLGVYARVLGERARTKVDAPVLEIVLVRATHRETTLNAYLEGSRSTAPFHRAYVHADGSFAHRYLPLDVLLAGVEACSRTPPPRIVRTRAPSTLEELRDLALEEPSARPLCVPDAEDTRTFRVHGDDLDGYRMALHDVSHLVVLGDRPAGRARAAARVFDALSEELARIDVPSAARDRVHDLLDHVISAYDDVEGAIAFVDARGAEIAADAGGDLVGLGARVARRLSRATG